jgi:hypothetical protein
MKTETMNYSNIVETIYGLPLEDKLEIVSLLEHNIADTRRTEIANSYKEAQLEEKTRKLKFSSKINELKKML